MTGSAPGKLTELDRASLVENVPSENPTQQNTSALASLAELVRQRRVWGDPSIKSFLQ